MTEQITPEKIKKGQKRVNKYLGKLNLEEIVGFSKGNDQIEGSIKNERGFLDYWNPDLRRYLGTLFFEDKNLLSGTANDTIINLHKYLKNSTTKKLIKEVSEVVDPLIDKIGEKQLTSYVFQLTPSKSAKENYGSIAEAHKEYNTFVELSKDPIRAKTYLENLYKNDDSISYWLASKEGFEKMFASELQAKQLDLINTLSKEVKKDGKKYREIDTKKLREYVRECIKGAPERDKAELYKDLVERTVKPKKPKK